jgi:hypothetical protein
MEEHATLKAMEFAEAAETREEYEDTRPCRRQKPLTGLVRDNHRFAPLVLVG